MLNIQISAGTYTTIQPTNLQYIHVMTDELPMISDYLSLKPSVQLAVMA